MSVLLKESLKNVNSNYCKRNVFGFLTLILIFNILYFIFYNILFLNKGLLLLFYMLIFFIFCTHVMAHNNAVHEREKVFPGFTDIFNNIGSYLKNGLLFSVFAILQYVFSVLLFLGLNYLLALSMDITGSFKHVLVTMATYLQLTVQAGIYTLFIKEIIIALLSSLFTVVLFLGNYANFIYDLKAGSLFNFLRGLKFLKKAKGDTFVLFIKLFLSSVIIFALLMLFISIASAIAAMISLYVNHGVRLIVTPQFIWLDILCTVIFTYIFGFLGIYLFDLVAQYIRTNQEEQIETQETEN